MEDFTSLEKSFILLALSGIKVAMMVIAEKHGVDPLENVWQDTSNMNNKIHLQIGEAQISARIFLDLKEDNSQHDCYEFYSDFKSNIKFATQLSSVDELNKAMSLMADIKKLQLGIEPILSSICIILNKKKNIKESNKFIHECFKQVEEESKI